MSRRPLHVRNVLSEKMFGFDNYDDVPEVRDRAHMWRLLPLPVHQHVHLDDRERDWLYLMDDTAPPLVKEVIPEVSTTTEPVNPPVDDQMVDGTPQTSDGDMEMMSDEEWMLWLESLLQSYMEESFGEVVGE